MTDPITSSANPRVKALAALMRDRKAREASGLFLLEGVAPVARAAKSGFEVVELWHAAVVAPIACRQAIATIPAVLSRITGKDNPQAVLGVVRQRWLPLPESLAGVWLALDRPRDPGNLGTIVRTADAVAAAGLILVGEATDAYSPECVRASSGSIVNVPLVRAGEAEFVDWAKRRSARDRSIIGTAGEASADYRSVAGTADAVLLMGNESDGLTPALRGCCTELVRIPMPGGTESLNLAVATGLMLYELLRERK